MKRQIATIEVLADQNYESRTILFSDAPRRLEAVIRLEHGNLTMTIEVRKGAVLVMETTVLRQAIDAYNEI